MGVKHVYRQETDQQGRSMDCTSFAVLTVVCLLVSISGAIKLDDCQNDGYVYITNDTSSTSFIKCSDVTATNTVTWIITKNGQNTTVATCPGDSCTGVNENVEVVRFVNSGYSALGIKSNHQQVAGDGAEVTCLTNSSSRACTIRIIDKLPTIYILVAEQQPMYAGDKADLMCRVADTESLPSLPVTYTWTSRTVTGGPLNCDTSVTDKSVCQFYLTPQHNKAQVRCDLSYRDYSNIPSKTYTVVLNVKYPPPQPPVITGNREVSVGESLTLVCRVYSGNPLVASVTFYCQHLHGDVGDTRHVTDSDEASYVSSRVIIQSVQTSDNGVTCQCGGNWEQIDLYKNISSVTLTVSGTGTAQPPVTSTGTAQPPVTSAITDQTPLTTTGSHGNTDSPPINPSTTTVNPAITPLTSTVTNAHAGEVSDDSTNVGAIAGGVIAAVVVIAVVVVVLVFIIKRRNSRPKPPPTPTRDPEYEEHINPVYGTNDPSHSSPNHNDIYGGGAADDEIPDIGYSAVGTRAHHPTTKTTAKGGSSAAGEEYAVVDKSKKPKNGAHAQIPLNTEYAVVNKSRKDQSPAQPQDEYAVVDKSRKNQPPAPSQDEYAVVDKARKKPAAKPKPGTKPKPSAAPTPTDDDYNSLSFQQSSHAPQQSRDVEQDYSHLGDVRSDADR